MRLSQPLMTLMFLLFSTLCLAQKSEPQGDLLSQTDLNALGLSDGADLSALAQRGRVSLTVGHGNYLIADTFDVSFATLAIAGSHGFAFGRFRQSLIFQDLAVDFKGRVTCLAVDAENGRAWVGGVVTENNSEHPSFTTEIHQPGRDVWFRVLDTGPHNAEPDRSTFMGFEGAAGIITSQEYCDAQIWPNDPPNDRTNPVTSGNILVKP